MKKFFIAAVAAIMLAFAPAAYADETKDCGPGVTLSQTITDLDSMGVPHVLMSGTTLEAFDAAIQEAGGPAKPAEITTIIGPAAEDVTNLGDPVFVLTFKADGCQYGQGTLPGTAYVDAVKKAFGTGI